MGASSSKIEEDKTLQLCRERKKFIRQALDGRCSLATAHVSYVQSLKNTGTAIRKFVEPEAPIESSLYTSTSATPEPFALTEKSLSHVSFCSPSGSQQVDAAEALSPSPSPPPPKSNHFQANHMKFRSFSSKKVEEKPPAPVIGMVTPSSTPQTTTPRSAEKPETSPETSPFPPETPPWDYFGSSHPIDHQFSFQEGKRLSEGLENVDDITHLKEDEGIAELEDEEEKSSFRHREESEDSDDEFEEPSADTLVQSFENLNRLNDHNVAINASPATPSVGRVTSQVEFLNQEKTNSPVLSPVRATRSPVAGHNDMNKTPGKEDSLGNTVAPKDFFSSMKDIESLFIKASESGKEVPRMLEANKLHFRPIFPGKESRSAPSTFFKACFSCGEDHNQVQEEPAQTSVKYLTWHRTESSRSSSSRTPLGLNSDDVEELTSNLFDNIYLISGSHASTLDRLYAWERKLYDEVKASEMVRSEYDSKCKILRQLESKGESSYKIDKTRAVVKDLHSRIRVAIHRINSISYRIEELRDQELQLQLEELIQGLRRMWEVMLECHKLQFRIISVAYRNSNIKISIQSESHRQITIHLENELSLLSSSFVKWINAQKSYVQAINNWLVKCAPLPPKDSRRKRRAQAPNLRRFGPPIYVTCGVWLDKLDTLLAKDVADSIKGLAADTAHFLPHQEKNQGKSGDNQYSTLWKTDNGTDSAVNMLRDEASEDWVSGIDRFRSSLEGFLGQLTKFAESSVKMYDELEKAIQDAKSNYDRLKSHSLPKEGGYTKE